jgi:protoheme IX farnesyltransferase
MTLPVGASRSSAALNPTSQLPAQLGLKARSYLALTKPRIIELLLVTTLPTMFVARRGVPSVTLMALTMIGGALAAGGANAFNMVLDRDIDRLMKRTQNRPLVTGELTPVAATVFAAVLEVGAFFELWLTVNMLSAILAVSATAFYVFVYTILLKRTSSQNIVIGGAAGAVPVLVGWTAVTGRLAWAPVVLFAVIFIWTPPHFWSLAIRYREDYATANVPMLPVVATFKRTARQILFYSVLLVACTLVFAEVGHMGIFYEVSAALLGAGFLLMALRLLRQTSEKAAMAMFRYSITYLTLLFAAMAADVVIRHP